MIFIFHPQPPQGRSWRGTRPGGVKGGIPPKIVCYVKSWVFNSREFKNDLHFSFQGNPTPARALPKGWGGLEGVYQQESCVLSILGFSIMGNPKMITIFILGYPNPHKGTLGGGAGPAGAGGWIEGLKGVHNQN